MNAMFDELEKLADEYRKATSELRDPVEIMAAMCAYVGDLKRVSEGHPAMRSYSPGQTGRARLAELRRVLQANHPDKGASANPAAFIRAKREYDALRGRSA